MTREVQIKVSNMCKIYPDRKRLKKEKGVAKGD
jgi:hypothetical protein